MGAEGDRICAPDDVRATARHHGVDATILPGLAHMLMLERGWEAPARALARWLDDTRLKSRVRPYFRDFWSSVRFAYPARRTLKREK